MFDLGASELLLIVIVAVIVIGPKDMPLALRTAGRWIGKMRRLSSHFRTGLDAMIREAEMEEMEKKWKEQNEKVMREHPEGAIEMEPTGALPPPAPNPLRSGMPPAPSAEAGGAAAAAHDGGTSPDAPEAGKQGSNADSAPPPPAADPIPDRAAD